MDRSETAAAGVKVAPPVASGEARSVVAAVAQVVQVASNSSCLACGKGCFLKGQDGRAILLSQYGAHGSPNTRSSLTV